MRALLVLSLLVLNGCTSVIDDNIVQLNETRDESRLYILGVDGHGNKIVNDILIVSISRNIKQADKSVRNTKSNPKLR